MKFLYLPEKRVSASTAKTFMVVVVVVVVVVMGVVVTLMVKERNTQLTLNL